MKRILAFLLTFVMLFGMAACSSGDDAPAESGAPAEGGDGAVTLRMATGGTSGTYYGYSGIIAQVLNEAMPDKLDITVQSTGASSANIQLVETGDNEIAIVQNDIMSYANQGVLIFEEPITEFSAVMSCYPETVQIVSNKDIVSVADLMGKTISVGAPDSGTRYNAEQILAAYGITFDDINVVYESFADSVDSLNNGTVDAAFITAGHPTTAITELATSYDFNLVQLDDEHIETLQADHPFYTKEVIPAGTYTNVDYDVTTVAVMATIIASNDVSEEAIYNFLTGVFENQAQIAELHPTKGPLINIDTAVSGIDIPFHSGAVKYFTEQGKDVG